jgi:hypothetical protein
MAAWISPVLGSLQLPGDSFSRSQSWARVQRQTLSVPIVDAVNSLLQVVDPQNSG